LILLSINPYLFSIQDDQSRFLLIFSVVTLTILFPLFAVFLMRKLDLIKSFTMDDRHDRIGPLITTGVFYLWLFINIKGNSLIPPAFSFFVLGATIALFMSLMMNSFTKISLHTVGMGGLLAGVLFIRFFFSYDRFIIDLSNGLLSVNTNLILFIVIIAAGAVGTSRLLLKAHTSMDVYGGYIIGIFSQIVAFRIMIG